MSSVCVQQLEQVRNIETACGLHFLQGPTNYCGYCCIANAFVNITQESISIKEMDTLADELWLQMVDDPSLWIIFF